MTREKKYVLMSIKPIYAEKIKNGEKTIELRKKIPNVKEDDIIIFYESNPVKRITMSCVIRSIITLEPEQMWELYHDQMGIERERFDHYFVNSIKAYGIVLKDIKRIKAEEMKTLFSWMKHPPQSFRYVSEEDYQRVQSQEIE